MSEKISVVVPVFNIEKYVERCAYSILNQTYANLEIIMVDDGSTDGSGKIIDKIAASDSRIKVIHKENGGVTRSVSWMAMMRWNRICSGTCSKMLLSIKRIFPTVDIRWYFRMAVLTTITTRVFLNGRII